MGNSVRYLLELRKRLLRVLIVVSIVFGGLAFFANQIYELLTIPLIQHFSANQGLIATSIPAPFLVPFKSVMMVTIFIVAPYLLYQLWGFIAPALYKDERKFTWLLLLSSVILFYLGIMFAYFLVLPMVFKFFIYVAPASVEVRPDIGQYLSFIMRMFFAFGFCFEVPIAVVLLVATGITTHQTLSSKRPYVIVGAFVVGMLLTPPDVISQIMLAVPLWLLYEGGLGLCLLMKKNKKLEQSGS